MADAEDAVFIGEFEVEVKSEEPEAQLRRYRLLVRRLSGSDEAAAEPVPDEELLREAARTARAYVERRVRTSAPPGTMAFLVSPGTEGATPTEEPVVGLVEAPDVSDVLGMLNEVDRKLDESAKLGEKTRAGLDEVRSELDRRRG